MKCGSCCDISSIIYVLVLFSMFLPILSSKDFREEKETSMEGNKLKNMKSINARLRMINKPYVKSIESPEGDDIVDCVLFHLQPAFDLPELRGSMIPTEPELPEGDDSAENNQEIKQLWNSNGESCPNGTIPIRRTSASDIIWMSKYGKKYSRKQKKYSRKQQEQGIPIHEHSIGYVNNGEFYGAKASLNVWKPNVFGNDFSLSQIWVMSDYYSNDSVNTVEAGWQVYSKQYMNNLPRLFTYWTPDGYRSGCYNLLCPGFVQTSRKVALGAAIAPLSTYNGPQYDVSFAIWKGRKTGRWWLRVGTEVVGYWSLALLTDLRSHAKTIEYGGEVYYHNMGRHTSTQMGSGHFELGARTTAFVRNLKVVNSNNVLTDVTNLQTLAENPNCYGVRKGYNNVYGNYIYFGGPGYNPNCRY